MKLEIFKFTLNNKENKVSDPSFRDFFNSKFNENNKKISDQKLLMLYHKFLSEKLDNKGEYIQFGKKPKKAFSLKNTPTLNNKSNFISGILKGGFKGDNKTSSEFNDTKTSSPLDNKVINNLHFFLIYTPLESNVGFIIFQSYPQENIRLDFNTFLAKEVFRIQGIYNNIQIESFLPKSIKEKYADGAILSRLTFSDKILASELTDDSIKNISSHYNVKVIIEPTGEGEIKVEDLDKGFLNKLKNTFALNKELDKFNKTSGQLNKNGKKTAFKLGGLDEILPIIELGEEYMNNDLPDFNKISEYSTKLLDILEEEFYSKLKAKKID